MRFPQSAQNTFPLVLTTLIENQRSHAGLSPSHRGFTLVELLITIAVIGILTALSFPAFSKVQKLALEAQCLNNLRSIGALIPTYAHDHDGLLPGPTPAGLYASYTKTNIGDPRNLCHFFIPYVDPTIASGERKLMKIFVCPAATKLMDNSEQADPRCYGTTATRKNNIEMLATPFGKRDGNAANSDNWIKPSKIQTLSKPAETIAIMDRAEPSSTSEKSAHLTVRNFLFFDGHVRKVSLDKIRSATEILE